MVTWQEKYRCVFDQNYFVKLPKRHLIEAANALELWQHNLPRKEKTGVYKMFKVPSLVISLDCAPDSTLNVIDVQGDAAGLGIANLANPKLAARLKGIKRDWPKVKFLASPDAFARHDYNFWLNCAHTPMNTQQADLLFIIADQGQMLDYGKLSAMPLETRGDKSYGSRWLWDTVTSNDFKSLFGHWSSGFCLKSQSSVNMKGLYIFHPRKNNLDRHGIHGASTRSQILRALKENGTMYCQPFKESVFIPGPNPAIHRLFFLYDVKKREYVYAGGLLISRPNLKTCSIYNSTIGTVN